MPPASLQRLMDEAPFVRLLARSLLAEETDEVVQQTWLRALQHGGEHVEAPRAWLGQIVRNVARNLRRDRRRQRVHEGAVDAKDLVPSSAELMQLEEQRRLLVAAVDQLPEQLRAVVLLRYFDGLLPQAIAQRLGLPVTTVWNQLRRALQLLRERLDADHGGDRRAWLLPLVPFAAPGRVVGAGGGVAASVGFGVMVLSMKTKLVAAIGVMCVVATVMLWSRRDPVPGAPEPMAGTAGRTVAEVAQLPRADVQDAVLEEGRREVGGPEVAAASTGGLVVRVRHAEDSSPAAGVMIGVRRRGTDFGAGGERRRSDAAGLVSFVDLAVGWMQVTSDRFGMRYAEIRAGQTTELEFVLEAGVLLTGLVVDATGTPVAGASVDVLTPASSEYYEVLAVSGADGRFAVRGAPSLLFVGARAMGHGASAVEFFESAPGNRVEVRLQLAALGGAVDGLVVDEQGRPVRGALVCIGDGDLRGHVARNGVAPTLPALVRSDEEGRFQALGVAPGLQPVAVRAPRFAPWSGTCEVVASLTVPLRIDLSPGGAIRGVVHTAAGEPAARAFVTIGRGTATDWFFWFFASTAVDGSFELSGLPVGDLAVSARHGTFGKVEQPVRTVAGEATVCELQLSVGIELRGRILDESGQPVAGAQVECDAVGMEPFWGLAPTDAEGRFTVTNCPAGQTIVVRVEAPGCEPLRLDGVQPGAGPVDVRLRRLEAATGSLRGVVVSPTGEPLANATVGAGRLEQGSSDGVVTGADGRFEVTKLAPGSWRLRIQVAGYPMFVGEPMALAADATLDLGQVVMPVGGTAVVTIEGGRAGAWFQCVGADDRPRTDWLEKDGTLVSPLLVPGQHRLLVSGKTVAAQAIAFVVRAGEVTRVAVKLGTGTRQRIEIAPPVLDPLPGVVALVVHRGGELLRTTGIALRAGEASVDETCLAPGDYTVTIADGERRLARATFTVGATEAPPLRLELR
jgi:RNA polymerase sigma factor (sigma-70 family)